MKVILTDDFGVEHDVTEGVLDLYYRVTQSMNWSSGFYSTEEELDVMTLGVLLAVQNDEEVVEHLDGSIKDEKRSIHQYDQMIKFPDNRFRGHWTKEDFEKLQNNSAVQKAKHEEQLKKLEDIRAAKIKLLKMTDDVTDFDEQPELTEDDVVRTRGSNFDTKG